MLKSFKSVMLVALWMASYWTSGKLGCFRKVLVCCDDCRIKGWRAGYWVSVRLKIECQVDVWLSGGHQDVRIRACWHADMLQSVCGAAAHTAAPPDFSFGHRGCAVLCQVALWKKAISWEVGQALQTKVAAWGEEDEKGGEPEGYGDHQHMTDQGTVLCPSGCCGVDRLPTPTSKRTDNNLNR